MQEDSPLNYSKEDSCSSDSDEHYQQAYQRLKQMQQLNHSPPSDSEENSPASREHSAHFGDRPL
jgi:hypothetical protein